ncbi:MAG: hypothetical protein AAGJ95_10425 [Cyanobacteria bacterium J06554_11]
MAATTARKQADITDKLAQQIYETPLFKLSKTELVFLCKQRHLVTTGIAEDLRDLISMSRLVRGPKINL